jgi:hypothetical protein
VTGARLVAAACLASLAACGGGTSEVASRSDGAASHAPAPAETAPRATPVVPSREGRVVGAQPLSAEERSARERLVGIVRQHGLDPENGWALGHALLALGLDATLADGTPVVDHVFAHFGEVVDVGGTPVVGFPRERGGHPVEPHAELFLQKTVDLGARPDRAVVVQGRPLTLAAAWRGALWRSWVDGASHGGFASWNDVPWALQAIAAWAPPGLAWTAKGGHAVTLDGFTDALVADVVRETRFLADAKASGGTFQKRGQGIFAYTCGGAHLIQGAAYAVARGFGAPDDRATMVEQARLQAWRFPIELAQTDAALQQVLEKAPALAVQVAVQRLKFTGHHLETMARFVALGLVPADDPEVAASLAAGRAEVVRSVELLGRLGVLDHVAEVRAQREQTFLDLVGDGAHAVHALDLATGTAALAY